MFIGHFAVGLGSQRLAPRTPLPWLLAAPLFLDLLWPIFLLLGWESVRVDPSYSKFTPLDLHDYPYSHSLAGALVWTVLFAGLYLLLRRDRRGAIVLAAGVFSHFVLDWLTHPPDMPLWPGSATKVGLGLWSSVPGTLVVEVGLFVAGVWLYATGTKPKGRSGVWSLWSLVAFLAIVYLGVAFGPPPPSAAAVGWVGLGSWGFLLWARWIGRTRESRQPAAAAAR